MSLHYSSVVSDPDFSKIEEKVIKFWQENNIFRKSVDNITKDNSKDFVFYDGPPFANGLPHYGHLLTGFIKDTFARYKTMCGFRVERRFGWDCHGLPAEMLTEKELGISGRVAIEQFGIEKFNDYCKKSVMKFSLEWEKYVTRQARWVDFENDYKTMDKSFMESVLWAFKQLYDKGLVYESLRVVPYSWACQTPLSNFETRIDNAYREKASKTVTAAFELCKRPEFVKDQGIEQCKILVWTTTPWTLPSNLALAVGPKITYIGAVIEKILYIFSKGYSKNFENHCEKNSIEYTLYEDEICADDLIGLSYKPLFDYFANIENAFRILSADFVIDGEGTGIVHTAPGFGEDDFILCQKNNIPANIKDEKDVLKILSVICPIDDGAKFTETIKDFAGMNVFDANDEIIKKLKEQGSWFKTEQYLHNYPHCWRTDTPLIYRAMSSWYVKVTELKDRMISLNENVNWIPLHIRDGQFGKWLEGIKDWSISRNRFWGTPLPIWKSDNPEYPRIDVYGSIEELEKDFGVKVKDLHRQHIDSLVRPNPDDLTGKSMMRRVHDVFDCWFESGSMPYGQIHYPFENKEWFEKNFPADFITEYVAQTRGWFYTLFVLSTALFDRPPFLNCICHGVVLDVKGQKLSKRLNNYADPMEIFDKYGADALRFLMLSSPVVGGGDLLLDKDGIMVRDVLRTVIKPIWNSYNFFVLYANSDEIKAEIIQDFNSVNHIMDVYILSCCKDTIIKMNSAMIDSENFSKIGQNNTKLVCNLIIWFFEQLNNWYIRRCRQRFWSEERSQNKLDAYNTLYTVLYYMLRAMAPVLPFVTEAIWLGLNFNCEESVHLAAMPFLNESDSEKGIDEVKTTMLHVMEICNVGLFIRNANGVRVRQPISKMTIYSDADALLNLPDEYREIIKDEVNVKDVIIKGGVKNVENLQLKLNLNFSALGKRIPEKVKDLIRLAKQDKWELLNNEKVIVGEKEGEHYIIEKDEFNVTFNIDNKFASVIYDAMNSTIPLGIIELDPVMTRELILEGLTRDIIRFVQQERKNNQLDVSDHINLLMQTQDSDLKEAMKEWNDYIKQQTLCESITILKNDQKVNNCQEIQIDGKKLSFVLQKVEKEFS